MTAQKDVSESDTGPPIATSDNNLQGYSITTETPELIANSPIPTDKASLDSSPPTSSLLVTDSSSQSSSTPSITTSTLPVTVTVTTPPPPPSSATPSQSQKKEEEEEEEECEEEWAEKTLNVQPPQPDRTNKPFSCLTKQNVAAALSALLVGAGAAFVITELLHDKSPIEAVTKLNQTISEHRISAAFAIALYAVLFAVACYTWQSGVKEAKEAKEGHYNNPLPSSTPSWP